MPVRAPGSASASLFLQAVSSLRSFLWSLESAPSLTLQCGSLVVQATSWSLAAFTAFASSSLRGTKARSFASSAVKRDSE